MPDVREPTEAEIRRWEAEAVKFNEEARKAAYEADAAAARAAVEKIETEREEYRRRKELANNEYHHIYYFGSQVSDSSVQACIGTMQTWSRLEPGCDMELIFSSPGGSVVAGMELWDFLQHLRRKSHTITTTALGMAASMAGILLQAGDVRAIGSESYLMIHEASFGAGGKIGEVEDTVEWVKKVQERIVNIFVSRMAQSGAEKPLSKAAFKRKWTRKDWWLSSDEALKHGLVDEVR